MDVTGSVQGGKRRALKFSKPVYQSKSMKDPARVKLNTRIIFERLLNKKLGCKYERIHGAAPSGPSRDHLDDLLHLNLPTDIEGDGFKSADTSPGAGDDGLPAPRSGPLDHSVPHHLHAEIVERSGRGDEDLAELFPQIPQFVAEGPRAPDTTPQVDRPETTGESDLFDEVAILLGAIGDEVQRDAVFQQEMRKCATSVASQVAYQAFEKTVDSFLDSHKQHLPDASERYQVAFVVLCLKTALTMANNSAGAVNDYADKLLNNAVNYVGTRFPDWI